MLIQVAMWQRISRPRCWQIIYDPKEIDEKSFKRRRMRVNRPVRRGESKNARRARLLDKRFFDSFRPLFQSDKRIMKITGGKSVAMQLDFEALFPGVRMGCVVFDENHSRGVPLPTHMKVTNHA